MAKRKPEQLSKYPEKLKRVTKLPSAPLQCPVCNVTLRPNNLATHYEQELERVQAVPPLPRSRKRTSSQAGLGKRRNEQSLTERAQAALDTVRRRRIIFEHPSEGAGPSSCPPSHCLVCGFALPADQEAASSHVASCLTERDEGSSEEESYEEYTWCNVTRVRATSLLSPQARADMFDGIVMSNVGDASIEVDVVDDDTMTYGPAQYSEAHIQECDDTIHTASAEPDQNNASIEGEQSSGTPISTVQCLICMGGYTEPLVSVICWHVYCENCWLQALKAQKLCPKCKRITCAGDLRRIFL